MTRRGLELVVHGTTIGLNAIIQRRGARMAMVVSPGNRDVLEIARLRLPSSYDFTEPREAPLVPRRPDVRGIGARTRSDGTVECRPDAAELDDLARRIAATGVEAVAVMLLNSYRDASLEREVGEALRSRPAGRARHGNQRVLWPEVREYERSLVAGLNAYIHPLMTRYFDRLTARVAAKGVAGPIYITANNGGTLSLDSRATPADRHGAVRPGVGRRRLHPRRWGCRAGSSSSPSTWAARPPTSRSSPRARPSSRPRPSSATSR